MIPVGALIVALASAQVVPTSQSDLDDQRCEMCGLLVYHLEIVHKELENELDGSKKTEKAGVSPARKRAMRAELPAEITGKMEDFMEKNACAAISRGALCGSNGDDGSKLRNPRGIGFKPEECRERLKQVCEELAPSATDDLIEAAMTGSAADCEDILPSGSCSAAVAQKLLGLDYQKGGTEGANFAPHRTTNLGVKDVWKKSARSQISHNPSDVQQRRTHLTRLVYHVPPYRLRSARIAAVLPQHGATQVPGRTTKRLGSEGAARASAAT